MPIIVRDYTDDEATIIMVESIRIKKGTYSRKKKLFSIPSAFLYYFTYNSIFLWGRKPIKPTYKAGNLPSASCSVPGGIFFMAQGSFGYFYFPSGSSKVQVLFFNLRDYVPGSRRTLCITQDFCEVFYFCLYMHSLCFKVLQYFCIVFWFFCPGIFHNGSRVCFNLPEYIKGFVVKYITFYISHITCFYALLVTFPATVMA